MEKSQIKKLDNVFPYTLLFLPLQSTQLSMIKLSSMNVFWLCVLASMLQLFEYMREACQIIVPLSFNPGKDGARRNPKIPNPDCSWCTAIRQTGFPVRTQLNMSRRGENEWRREERKSTERRCAAEKCHRPTQ